MDEKQEEFKNDSLIPVVLKPQDLTISSERVKKDFAKYWDKEYINSTIEKISNPMYQMFFRFLWYSGVRVSEAVSLKKENIDFENYTMTVKWLKSRKYNYRIVPLHPLLKSLLQMFTAVLKADDRLFPFTRQRAWQISREYFKGSTHQFRHSFAVNWLRNDGDIIILHRILGHSKIQTTMEYLKIVPIDQGKELLKIKFE